MVKMRPGEPGKYTKPKYGYPDFYYNQVMNIILLIIMENKPWTQQNEPGTDLWGMGEYDIYKYLYIPRNRKLGPQ